MLYGMIDIGSNTLRLAIYLIEGRRAEMLMKKKELVGLAGYVTASLLFFALRRAAVVKATTCVMRNVCRNFWKPCSTLGYHRPSEESSCQHHDLSGTQA